MIIKIEALATALIFTSIITYNADAMTPEDDYSQHIRNLLDLCPPSLGTNEIYSIEKCSSTIQESISWANSSEGSKFLTAIPTYRNMFQRAVDKARSNLTKPVIK
jgi:hypothetical protein